LDLGPVSNFVVGSVYYRECVPAYVVVTLTDTIVFLATTPHLENEELSYDPASREFFSPAHAERYSIFGEWLSGPPTSGLLRCETTIANGILRLTVESDAPICTPVHPNPLE
jgi:hypothetical protein